MNKQDYDPDRHREGMFPLHRRTTFPPSDEYWQRIEDVLGGELLEWDARAEDFNEMGLKVVIERLLHEIETLKLTGERDKFVVGCLCKAIRREELTTGEALALNPVFRV